MPGEHTAAFQEAKDLLSSNKYFDAVQKINACMETFELVLGGADAQILKDPEAFLKAKLSGMSDDQKTTLSGMYETRGDILAGLGANKRAVVDYGSALTINPKLDQVKAKKEKMEAAASAIGKGQSEKIPCTILTGFLGSGKTTLLNHILKANHGKRIAVIENEFGEVGIDDALVAGGNMAGEENIVEMNNGCICCTVRGDLIEGLKKFAKTANKKKEPLDAVMIETTGLADPAPVAQTFFADDFIQSKYRLDGILTLVDAHHIIQHLDEEKPEGVENEAVEQVAFADRILLNKCDLVEPKYLDEVEKRIRMINEAVPIKRTTNSEVDMDYILGIQAFDLDKIMNQDEGFLDDNTEHEHDNRVSSVGIHVQGEVENDKLNEWIGWLLKEKGVDLFRSKGVLAVKGMKEKFVFQAIHMLFAGSPQKPWEPGEERECKMVFIGKNLDREELTSGFMKCMAK